MWGLAAHAEDDGMKKNSIFELKHDFFKSYLFAAAVIEWSRVNLNLFYLLNSSLCKVDLHLTYKKPIHVNNNVAHISVNKLPNNIDNNETKYVMIIRWNQHVANRRYMTYKGNKTSTFLLLTYFLFERF